jgi:23S rRNA (cytosine1962-C5)-methyltransferase
VTTGTRFPLVLHEDDHLLAIHKPAGVNTHKPDPCAQDGIHEWLQKQRPEWRKLSILQRLDKETSGIMVFGKTVLANKSLTEQFERSTVEKTYRMLTLAQVARRDARPTISTPIQGKPARTAFRVVEQLSDSTLVEAQPTTGRTHQVRIHSVQAGFPILGDPQYGSARPGAPRLMLHASSLAFQHPASGKRMKLEAPLPRAFHDHDPIVCAEEMRLLLFPPDETDCFRLISGLADGFPDLTVDRFGEAVLVQTVAALRQLPHSLPGLSQRFALFTQDRMPGARSRPQSSVLTPRSFPVRENGLRYLIRMDQGFSPGLFLDQRENRRRLREIATGKEVLNCFAYTCSFSVAAAAGGARTTSLDLSRSYLEWGRENFRANALDLAGHDFVYGDVFDWLRRFAKRGRHWDIVVLDPPTFGATKQGRVFRAGRDYIELVGLACKLVRPNGILFCSTNQRSLAPDQFRATIERGLAVEKRRPAVIEFETQPLDFRVAEGEKPYLKTFWITLG